MKVKTFAIHVKEHILFLMIGLWRHNFAIQINVDQTAVNYVVLLNVISVLERSTKEEMESLTEEEMEISTEDYPKKEF